MPDVRGVMRLQSGRVKNHAEECACDWCGGPIYLGDTVLFELEGGRVWCSERCAADDNFDAGYGNGGTVGTAG